jgi:hypothetical protein
MKRRVQTVAAVAGAFMAGVVVGPMVAAWAQDGGRADTYRLLNLFGDVFERVRAEYVEPINDRDAVENAINGMLTGLDPHSSYLNQRSYRDMQVQTRGEFGGLGIEVTQENGYIKVISPIDETQAARAPGTRPYAITRAGGPGLGRYAQTWSGDNSTNWDNLRWNIRTGLQMSLSGLFNIGHDVGGFFGPSPGPELFVRWVQACCLNPRMVMNSWKPGSRNNVPWLHPEVTVHVAAAIRLRYTLLPHMYSLLAQAAQALHQPAAALAGAHCAARVALLLQHRHQRYTLKNFFLLLKAFHLMD